MHDGRKDPRSFLPSCNVRLCSVGTEQRRTSGCEMGWVPLVSKAPTPETFISSSRLGTFVPSRDSFDVNAWMGASTHPRIEVYYIMNKKEGRTLGPPFLLAL